MGLMLFGASARAITLKEAFEASGPRDGYDRWVELETGVVYTGGLMFGRVYSPITNEFLLDELGQDVRIVGNGAILDLQGEQICISYCDNRLDISDCVVINGCIRFRGDNDFGTELQPVGSVRYVTFHQPQDYGIRLQGAGRGVTLERNLVVDTIDTGIDFAASTGLPGPLMPTGTAIGMSVQTGDYGWANVHHNWTYFSNPEWNAEEFHHYSYL